MSQVELEEMRVEKLRMEERLRYMESAQQQQEEIVLRETQAKTSVRAACSVFDIGTCSVDTTPVSCWSDVSVLGPVHVF